MKQIYKLFSFIIVALAFTSCEDDFDYNPSLDNRTLLDVESYTFNDNNLNNVENYNEALNRSYAYCYSPTLKAYYENYFKEMTLIKWDNGKYEINTYALRETTDPQKPKKENGKIQLNFKRTKHDVFQWDDLYWYYGTIKLVEVEHNRFECEIYDDEYNITFSATLQFKEVKR